MHLGRAGGCILQNLIAAYHRKCLHIEQHTFISRFRFVSAEADAKVDCSRISLKRVLSLGTRAVTDSPSSEPWTHHIIAYVGRCCIVFLSELRLRTPTLSPSAVARFSG